VDSLSTFYMVSTTDSIQTVTATANWVTSVQTKLGQVRWGQLRWAMWTSMSTITHSQ